MAEKAGKKSEASSADKKDHGKDHGHDVSPAAASGGAKGGIFTKLPVLLGGVMIIEAAVLFAGFKFIGGGSPHAAAGAELAAAEHGGSGAHGGGKEGEKGEHKPIDKKTQIELQVVDFRAPNKLSGRTFLYDVSIFVVTRGEHQEKVKGAISSRDALIKDRVRTIIAQSDPEKLGGGSEPGLETLRRQVKYQLDEIIGEGLVDEVLVPRCIPFRTDY